MKVTSQSPKELVENIDSLSRVLIDTVKAGGAVGFLAPLSKCDADNFWKNSIYPELVADRRILFVAKQVDRIVGTVQLLSRLQPNQPHRCEIAKMMVHPDARRQGIGRSLMEEALKQAEGLNKTLVTLDTRTGDVAESLYRSLGFTPMGIVPGFALNPDGKVLHDTTYLYKQL